MGEIFNTSYILKKLNWKKKFGIDIHGIHIASVQIVCLYPDKGPAYTSKIPSNISRKVDH